MCFAIGLELVGGSEHCLNSRTCALHGASTVKTYVSLGPCIRSEINQECLSCIHLGRRYPVFSSTNAYKRSPT